MADTFADHLKQEAKKKGPIKAKDLAKQQSAGKSKSKVQPEDDHAPCAADTKKHSEHGLSTAEAALIEPYTFAGGGGGLCGGAPTIVTIKGLPAAAVRMVGLTGAQVNKIYKCFNKIDADKSKQIDFEEFCEFIETVPTPFSKDVCDRMAFGITDIDGDGKLSFDEFLFAAILLGTFSQDQILYIMFEMFDGNGNMFIDHKEFGYLTSAVEELAGSMFPGNYSSFCTQFDKDGDGLIDFNEFMGINKNFPMVFFPALKMQEAMRKHTLGAEIWKKLEDKFDANHRKELQVEYDAEIKDADEAGRPQNLKAPRKPKSFYELILELNAKMKASHSKHKKHGSKHK